MGILAKTPFLSAYCLPLLSPAAIFTSALGILQMIIPQMIKNDFEIRYHQQHDQNI